MRVLRRLVVGVLAFVVLLVVIAVALAVRTPDARRSPGWTRLADMPDPRGETATAVLDRLGECPEGRCTPTEHLVVAGGIAGFGRTVATVSRFFLAANLWVRGPDLPQPRDHAAAAAMGGAVFVSGGSRGVTGEPEPNLWIMRADGSGWDALEPMPEGRAGHVMVALEGRLFVIGGRGRTGRVLVYEPAAGWTTGPPLPGPRNHLATVVAGGRIWAIGGRDRSGVLRRVDVYDPVLGVWAPGPDLPVSMSAMAAGVLDGAIHVVGGERPSLRGGVIDAHFRLDAAAGTWTSAPRAISAVHGVAGGTIADALIVAGGSRRQGALSVLGWTGITQRFVPRDVEGGRAAQRAR